MVLPKWGAVIFTNGCFWHGHDCDLFRWPRTRADFWRSKIEGNRQRDARDRCALAAEGWRVLTIWECSIKGIGKLGADIVLPQAADWLGSSASAGEIRGTAHAGG